MLPLALLLSLLILLLLVGQRASSRTFDHLFVRLPSLCLGVCLLCTRLSSHFFVVHSVVIVCAGNIRLLFNLLSFVMQNIPRAEVPLLVIKMIPKKTSPQRWRFSFALKRNKTKHKQNLYENVHATRE